MTINIKIEKKDKAKQIIDDINYGLNDCDEKIDSFVEKKEWQKDKYYEQLSKEDFIFVIKNKIEELEKLLEKKRGKK